MTVLFSDPNTDGLKSPREPTAPLKTVNNLHTKENPSCENHDLLVL